MCVVVKDGNELLVYKVMTGVLLALILAVILLRYARPAYEAFHKRCESQKPYKHVINTLYI